MRAPPRFGDDQKSRGARTAFDALLQRARLRRRRSNALLRTGDARPRARRGAESVSQQRLRRRTARAIFVVIDAREAGFELGRLARRVLRAVVAVLVAERFEEVIATAVDRVLRDDPIAH